MGVSLILPMQRSLVYNTKFKKKSNLQEGTKERESERLKVREREREREG